MNVRKAIGVFVIVAAAIALAPRVSEGQDKKKANVATKPSPRMSLQPDPGWLKRHETFVKIAKRGGVDVLFLGDSITDAWGGEGHGGGAGARLFAERFVPLKAANFGIGGDRTEHVLWRLQNGELDGIKPKVLMLMIGTNNMGSNSAEEIAEGVIAIVQEIHKRSPETKVLLLAVFPRNSNPPGTTVGKPDEAIRDKIKKCNSIFAKLDNGDTIKFMDIGEKFLEKDGTLTKEIMPDLLHLSERGYTIWADAVEGPIKGMLGK